MFTGNRENRVTNRRQNGMKQPGLLIEGRAVTFFCCGLIYFKLEIE